VFILIQYEHRSVKETADILGIPEGTVKSRFSRAKAYLQERLAVWIER
jgi:DNA-directed RNA polymerase specialized sigma24 family protein